ncbi:DddA-like double-stranded DNA deaminase toxin [Streptomyces sp. NPDC051172]|uniref:DddA-like double-stranded DNA deaminase toxin n=1 Tax=Streptomyces sp. NPDC051172 TaxID=3155796 RepID=UPI00341F1F04
MHNTACVNVAKVLAELADRRVTTGRIFDSSGKEVFKEIEAGGGGALVDATDEYLRKYGTAIHPKAKYYPAAQHVESQYAMWMRQNGVTNATVVMNNAEGVCGGPYGCLRAVKTILPEGSRMTIWYPGALKPEVILGEAAAP